MNEQPTTAYFTGLSRIYAQHRPSYPPAAIDFLLEGLARPITAADVGCGTGISSRLLAGRGVRVIGVDPNPEMLNQARAASSTSAIDYRVGVAEQLPIDDASVDLVLCAQAFHWFEAASTLREFHRITKSSQLSRVGLMWNLRDDTDLFTAGYSEVVRRSQEDAAKRGMNIEPNRSRDPTLGDYFQNARTAAFPNLQQLDLEALLGRIRSASYFPRSGPFRDELEMRLQALFEEHARAGFVTLVHRTEVTIADRVD